MERGNVSQRTCVNNSELILLSTVVYNTRTLSSSLHQSTTHQYFSPVYSSLKHTDIFLLFTVVYNTPKFSSCLQQSTNTATFSSCLQQSTTHRHFPPVYGSLQHTDIYLLSALVYNTSTLSPSRCNPQHLFDDFCSDEGLL